MSSHSQSRISLRRQQRLRQALTITGCLTCLALEPVGASGASFAEAIADYNSGNYAQALSKLKVYESAYPSNALVRYYIALCDQSLGYFAQAATEYKWVSENGDARLRSMAATGLSRLSSVHGSVSHSAVRATPSPIGTIAQGKVAKVIEFYADW